MKKILVTGAAGFIRKINHPFQKLASTPTTFRTVVHVDDYALQIRKPMLSFFRSTKAEAHQP